jgi:2,6-dihydroxypseudooxynicotine hydrolase
MTLHFEGDASVRAIINSGRMISDGVPVHDLQRAIWQVRRLDDWFEFWAETGERYEVLGEEALARASEVSAGEWFWHASLSFHYAQFMWFHDPVLREHGQRRKVELYNRAAPYLVPPGRRAEIRVDQSTVPGFLRLPEGTPPSRGWPCVLLIGGLESTKEESYRFENLCLRRGLATFAFDGPGQGEMFFEVKLQHEFERWTSSVVDWLEQQDAIDRSRLAVLGRSLGGYYALRSGAADVRLRAVVAWGFFHDMDDFETMPEHTKQGFLYVSNDSKEHLLAALDLSDVATDLRVPTLLLNGRHDPIFPERQMKRTIAALANAPKTVEIEPDGDHCCHNMGHVVRARMADWLARELTPAQAT